MDQSIILSLTSNNHEDGGSLGNTILRSKNLLGTTCM